MFSPACHNAAIVDAGLRQFKYKLPQPKPLGLRAFGTQIGVLGAGMQQGNGNDLLADLHCSCTMHAESNLEAPSLRKFISNCPPMSSMMCGYLMSNDLDISNAVSKLNEPNEIEQILESKKEEVSDLIDDNA